MLKLEVTENYRVETENEVKEVSESFRERAKTEGYIVKEISYKKKEKKSKGEIIDEGYLVTVKKVYGGFWDGLE